MFDSSQTTPAVALAELSAAVERLAALPPADIPDVTLVSGLEALLAVESRLRAVQAGWLAAASTRDATVAECGRSPRSWLIEDCNLGPAEASRRVRLARGLKEAPQLGAALAEGAVTAEHADGILRLLPQLPVEQRDAVEGALVEMARSAPPHIVGRAVDDILAALGVEASADAAHARRYGERGVDLAETFAGTGSLSGTLTPECLEVLRTALEAASPKAGADDERTLRQRRHDGLLEMAKRYLGVQEPTEAGTCTRIVVTMTLEQLLGDLATFRPSFDSGAPLPAATARRLACDAEIIPAVLGSAGEVLDIGRSSRVFTAAIRRAAKLRDGCRCAYPGCSRNIVELHHMVWWSRGGHTSLDNAAWLCAFHHWLVHEGGWHMRRNRDATYTFTDPDGREHTGTRHTPAA